MEGKIFKDEELTPFVTSEQIQKKMLHLTQKGKELKDAASEWVKAKSLYELRYARTIAELEGGKVFHIDDAEVKGKTAATIKEKAKALCWQEGEKLMLAELTYKNTLKAIEIYESQLNGWQSINKNLSHV